MVSYSGELIKNVDWDKVKEKLDVNYADLADAVIINSRILYCRTADDWDNFCKIVGAELKAIVIDVNYSYSSLHYYK